MSQRNTHILTIDTSFHRIARAMSVRHAVSSKTVDAYTPSQWCLIGFLYETPDATVKDVAQHLRCSSSAATQIVDGLVEKRCVMRKPHSTDKRSTCVSLVPRMRKNIEKLHAQKITFLKDIFTPLSDKEIEQFAHSIQKIVTSLP